jgi:hypothetical protein
VKNPETPSTTPREYLWLLLLPLYQRLLSCNIAFAFRREYWANIGRFTQPAFDQSFFFQAI